MWNVRTGRFDGGWTMEMAIPFKSLRYSGGQNQTWGIQMRRSIRRKNEWAHLTALPASMGGPHGPEPRLARRRRLVGLDAAAGEQEHRAQAVRHLARSPPTRSAGPPVATTRLPTSASTPSTASPPNLTADFTYNTDFAQVEVDEQQVNLTRFSLFFPEKRDFFLEGRGIFDFGRGGASAAGGGGLGSGGNSASATPLLFYSRRIGLNGGRVVPIDARRPHHRQGRRLQRRRAQHPDATSELVSGTPSTNFTVVRVKRDMLRRSTIGAMLTERSRSDVSPGSNQAYGVDGAFGFFENLTIGGYYARTRTDGLNGDNDSYQGRLDYCADRYGAQLEYLKVGDNFNPEVGFVQRDNFRRSFASLRFSPRPQQLKGVRKLT